MSERPHQEIDGAVDSSLSRLLAAWVRAVERHARLVLWGFALGTIGCLAYTGLVLGINASHRALLSEDLESWREYEAFADVFPIVDEAIFVVVDGDSPIQARDATAALAARLSEDDRFTSVYVPGGGRYFELPGDSTRRLILLETDFDYQLLLPAENAIAAIRAATTEAGLDADESIRVRITGNVALNYEEMILVARGAILAIVGSLVLVGMILAVALGTTRLVAPTLVTLLVDLVWTPPSRRSRSAT